MAGLIAVALEFSKEFGGKMSGKADLREKKNGCLEVSHSVGEELGFEMLLEHRWWFLGLEVNNIGYIVY